jgi:hypothetical protein
MCMYELGRQKHLTETQTPVSEIGEISREEQKAELNERITESTETNGP